MPTTTNNIDASSEPNFAFNDVIPSASAPNMNTNAKQTKNAGIKAKTRYVDSEYINDQPRRAKFPVIITDAGGGEASL